MLKLFRHKESPTTIKLGRVARLAWKKWARTARDDPDFGFRSPFKSDDGMSSPRNGVKVNRLMDIVYGMIDTYGPANIVGEAYDTTTDQSALVSMIEDDLRFRARHSGDTLAVAQSASQILFKMWEPII